MATAIRTRSLSVTIPRWLQLSTIMRQSGAIWLRFVFQLKFNCLAGQLAKQSRTRAPAFGRFEDTADNTHHVGGKTVLGDIAVRATLQCGDGRLLRTLARHDHDG